MVRRLRDSVELIGLIGLIELIRLIRLFAITDEVVLKDSFNLFTTINNKSI